VNEESSVEELRGEIDDLRREVYQQRTCLVFVWIFVIFLLLVSFFASNPVLIFISAGLIIVIGAYFLERRGL
jgi:Ca2+/H+ antiporter